jgi:hypothetical protein
MLDNVRKAEVTEVGARAAGGFGWYALWSSLWLEPKAVDDPARSRAALSSATKSDFLPAKVADLVLRADSFNSEVDICDLAKLADQGDSVAQEILSLLLVGVPGVVQSFQFPFIRLNS